jgi:hypothetical protein
MAVAWNAAPEFRRPDWKPSHTQHVAYSARHDKNDKSDKSKSLETAEFLTGVPIHPVRKLIGRVTGIFTSAAISHKEKS